MGISGSHFTNKDDENQSAPQSTVSAMQKPNTVYYKGKELTQSLLQEKKEIVTDIIICKTSLLAHWYVKVVLGTSHEKPLEMHYLDNSSIIVQKPKKDRPASIKETRYTPTYAVRLSDVLEVCLNFVKARSYSLLSYNCQDFVITLTNRFTDRSFLSLGPLSRKISRANYKTKVMGLEKEFLLKCQLVGVNSAVQFLQQTNAEIRNDIDLRASKGQVSGPEIEDFVNRVLTPESGEYRSSDFESFLKKQDSETIMVIRESMMQSWRLASFVIFLEEDKWGNREDILPPHKALKQYRSYNS